MKNYRIITLAVVGLCLSLSFLASPVLAVEKDGVMMKDGKMVRLVVDELKARLGELVMALSNGGA